jgi:hypothetical protein
MKNVAIGILAAGILAVAACGGGSGDADAVVRRDAGPDAGQVCNVLTNTGCATGEKCTWVRVSVGDTPALQLGQLACVPDGTVDVDGTCRYGAVGIQTGYDDCIGGNICLASRVTDQAQGVCREICGLSAEAAAQAPCPTDFSCVAYQKYFYNDPMNEQALAGLCNPSCNPLTQDRFDGLPYCGDPTPLDHTDTGSLACYGLPSDEIDVASHFSCAGIVDQDPAIPGIQNDNTHRANATPTCLNCCAPGNAPLYYESESVMELRCFAYCDPANTNLDTPGNANGDPTTPPADPGAWTCNRMGADGATEECRYLWWFEGTGVPISTISDAYGFCWDYTKYTWDDDGVSTTPEVAMPSCTTTERSNENGNTNRDGYWGCVDTATAVMPAVAPRPQSGWKRVPDGPAASFE